MGSSAFNELAASARECHAAVFGNSSSVTATMLVGTTTTTVQVVVHKLRTVTRQVDGDMRRISVRMVRFPGLTAIDHTAIITIAGTRYAVDEVGELQASGLNVQLKLEQTHLRSRTGYRGGSGGNISSNRSTGG